jgi:hypothetical protein
MKSTLQQYLAQVQEQLPYGGSRRARILSEIETHLLESWQDEQRRGIPAEEALALVLERFGSPTLVCGQFARLEMDRRLWQGRQCWQRACLFLAPLLFCYVIGALAFLGYDAPRQVFIHLTNDLGGELEAIHAWFVGVLLVGWLILGGPLACVVSGIQGIVTMKNWSRVTWLNSMCTIFGLAFLLIGIYGLITG